MKYNLSACLLMTVALAGLGWSIVAAPVPFARQRRETWATRRAGFVGKHEMNWANAPYHTTLAADGSYRAQYEDCAPFVGSWTYREEGEKRVLRIIESTTPLEAESWQTYEIVLQPGVRGGCVAGSGTCVMFSPPIPGK